MYRTNEPALIPDGRDLGAALREAVTTLPQGIYREEEQTHPRQRPTAEAILAPDYVKENAFTLARRHDRRSHRRDAHAADETAR